MRIDDSKEGEQKVLGLKEIEHPDLIYFFVNLEPVEFYIMRKREVQRLLYDGYKYYIAKLGGKRKSFLLQIQAKFLKGFEKLKIIGE